MDEMPEIPIYFYTRVYLKRPEVKGWYPTLLDNHPYKYVYLESDKK
jgi:oligopeptide transport system substrate-binding protein